MYNIVLSFLEDTVNDIADGITEKFLAFLENLFCAAFHIETWSGLDETVLSTAVVNGMLRALYGFMVLLLAAKLIWKGYKVYILWRDGESETSPLEMVGGAAMALITALIFPVLYDFAVDIAMEIGDVLLEYTGWKVFSSDADTLIGFFTDLSDYVSGNLSGMVCVAALVFLICLLLLFFKLLMKGVELLFFRLGIPFAAIGLVDSDGGAFKPYIQVFFKELATVLTQYMCMALGVFIASGVTFPALIVAIAFLITGISAPKILAQFFSPGGNGGISQKISTIAMVVRTFAA